MPLPNNKRRRAPGRVIDGDAIYLLRLTRDLFYVKDDGKGDPLGVAIPSVARHMSYAEADDACQRVKAQGYNGAVVTDRYGRMVDLVALESVWTAEQERARKFWGS